MKVNYNQFLAITYGDVFDFPLNREEIGTLRIGNRVLPKQEVGFFGGYFFLNGRKGLVKVRERREKNSKIKLGKVVELYKLFEEVETIEAVFVTGSVAVLNATEESDIDLMVITKPGTLWLTRLRLLLKLKDLRLLRDKQEVKNRVCVNMFLDAEHLRIIEENLYTAHEILLARCVFDRHGIGKKWLDDNFWIKKYLPGAKTGKISKREKAKTWSWEYLVNKIAFWAQYIYMKPKITNEKVGLGFAFFHPLDGSKYYIRKFEKRLKSLGIMEWNEIF